MNTAFVSAAIIYINSTVIKEEIGSVRLRVRIPVRSVRGSAF